MKIRVDMTVDVDPENTWIKAYSFHPVDIQTGYKLTLLLFSDELTDAQRRTISKYMNSLKPITGAYLDTGRLFFSVNPDPTLILYRLDPDGQCWGLQ